MHADDGIIILYYFKANSPPILDTLKLIILAGATTLTALGVLFLYASYLRSRQADDTHEAVQETTPQAPSKIVVGTLSMDWGPQGQGNN